MGRPEAQRLNRTKPPHTHFSLKNTLCWPLALLLNTHFRSSRNRSPVCYVLKKVVGISFALPKMGSVLGAFFGAFGVEVLEKLEDDDFADFEVQGLSGEVDFVARNEGQQALPIGRKLVRNGDPVHGVRIRNPKDTFPAFRW